MSYLQKQVSEALEVNEVMEYLIDFFTSNPDKKVELADIVNDKFSFEEIDKELNKLVSRNYIDEFYVEDKHLFEYMTYNEINPTEFLSEIVNELKEKGYRITDSRMKLIKIFTSSPNRHFTFDELVKQSGAKVNIATMYNNLATLLDERIINELYLDETKLFELNNKTHAHFICEKCNVVFNVNTKSTNNADSEVEEKYNFRINTKRIEFTGVCNNCQSASNTDNIFINNADEYPNIDEQELVNYFGYLQTKTNNNQRGISLVFLDQDDMVRLNKEFRGIRRPTDVLSFVEDTEDYLGDIIICYDYIEMQAKEYGHSFRRELLFLVTHGYLHLIGYDHIQPDEEKEMFALQNELLNKYGVGRDE